MSGPPERTVFLLITKITNAKIADSEFDVAEIPELGADLENRT